MKKKINIWIYAWCRSFMHNSEHYLLMISSLARPSKVSQSWKLMDTKLWDGSRVQSLQIYRTLACFRSVRFHLTKRLGLLPNKFSTSYTYIHMLKIHHLISRHIQTPCMTIKIFYAKGYKSQFFALCSESWSIHFFIGNNKLLTDCLSILYTLIC